jgi:hypothetical protein
MPPLCRPPRPNKATATAFRPNPASNPATSPAPAPGYRIGAATSVAATFQPDRLITGTAPCRSAES